MTMIKSVLFSVALFCISLCLCILPVSAQNSPVDNLSWQGFTSLYQVGIRLAVSLLKQEAIRTTLSISERIRIKKNAAALVRFAQAYTKILDELKESFPLQQKVLRQMNIRAKLLAKTATTLEEAALQGRAVSSNFGQSILKTPWEGAHGTLDAKQAKRVLDAIISLGAGNEMLVYYRMRQVVYITRQPERMADGLASLRNLLGEISVQRDVFRAMRQRYRARKDLAYSVYHAALLLHCGMLWGRLQKMPKGKRRASLLAQHQKRWTEVSLSLARLNAGFAQFWLYASGE